MNINNKEESSNSRRVQTFLAFIFSIYLLVIAAFLMKYSIGAFFPDSLPADLAGYFNLCIMDFRPEKAEKLQYFFCAGLFPLLYAFFLKLLNKTQIPAGENILKVAVVFEIALPLVLTAVLCKNLENDALNFLYLGIKSKAGYFAGALILLILTFFYDKLYKPLKYTINAIMGITAVAVVYTVCGLYYTPTYDFAEASILHFAAYFSPVYKVFSGQTIGVDFTNLYGYYPYFYNIVLKIFNNASVQFFSAINSLLVGLSTLFVGITLFLNIKNKVLAINFFLAYVYLYNFANIFSTHSLFFLQFMPHRIFFITLIAAFASVYLKVKNTGAKKLMKASGWVISVLAVLWNTESGLIVLLSWCLFLLYEYIAESKSDKKTIELKPLLTLIACPFIVFLSYLAIIQGVTFIRSGMWLDTGAGFYYQSLFYQSGYYMLPMPLFKHPWMALILVYFLALTKPLNALILFENTKQRAQNCLYLLLALCGLGIFVYYQGRSYILNLFGVSFPALIILGLFCSDFLEKYKENKKNRFISVSYITKTVLILLPLMYFSVSTFYTVFFKNPMPYFDLLKKNVAQNGSCINNYEFIKQNTGHDEKIDILTMDADTLYAMRKEPDNLKFNTFIDWCAKQQYQQVFDYLEKSDKTLVLDRYVTESFKKYEREKFEKLFLQKRYVITAQNKDLYILKQKMNK